MRHLVFAAALWLSTAALADLTLVNEAVVAGKTRVVTLSEIRRCLNHQLDQVEEMVLRPRRTDDHRVARDAVLRRSVSQHYYGWSAEPLGRRSARISRQNG